MHADDANLDLPTRTVIYQNNERAPLANILTVIHMPSGSQENVSRKYNIISSSNVSRRRCSVSPSLSTPLEKAYTDARTRLLCILLPLDTRLRRVAIAISLSPRPFAHFFFLFFFLSSPPSLLPRLLARDTFSDCFTSDEGTLEGHTTIYSAHVALSYRFHEISDTDKPSIRSSKSRGGQFSLMAAP